MKNYLKVDNKFNFKKILSNNNTQSYKKNHRTDSILGIFNLNIGIYLITPILLGVFIGYNLDKHFNKKPLFIMIFILLGTVGSFYNLIKVSKEQI